VALPLAPYSYSEKLNTNNPLAHLKVLADKIGLAFQRKYLSTLAVAAADSVTNIVNSSQANKLIPSPLIAGALRIALMNAAVKAQSGKQANASPKLTPGSNPEHPSSMHKVSLLEESLQI